MLNVKLPPIVSGLNPKFIIINPNPDSYQD